MMDPRLELTVRLGCFFLILGFMAVWEVFRPKRPLRLPKARRWTSNLALVFVDSAAVRFLFPFTGIWLAHYVESHQIGLLNQFGLPYWARVLLTVILLDFVIYLQHVMFHFLPVLWRLHQVHHADGDIDVTTGLRFHPAEIVISMVIKFSAIYLLGTPAFAVVLFEVILNGTAMFNHSNVALPFGLDRVLRLFLVTPDMHRVHHSVHRDETNSNFGFNLPIWDRLCGTYIAQPRDGHQGMEIGLLEYRDAKPSRLGWLLALPFRR